MPLRRTMSVLRAACQKRATFEGDTSIDNPEWNADMSEVYGCLWEAVSDSGRRYFETSTTFTMGSNGQLAEPADQLAMVDTLELVIDPTIGRVRRLYPIAPQERARWKGTTGSPRRFELVDDTFFLYPVPPAGTQVTLRYIPQATDLSNFGDNDVVDVVCSAGLAFLTWGTAALALAKDRRDVTLAIQEREKEYGKLIAWAENRAFHDAPRRIVEDDHGEDFPDLDWGWGYL